MPTAGATNQVLSLGTVFASDNGAMYRAVGWKALRDGLSLDDEAAIVEGMTLLLSGWGIEVIGSRTPRPWVTKSG